MLPYQGRLWYNLKCHRKSLSRYTSHQSQKVMIEYHPNPLMSCACPSWIEQVDALHLHFSNVSYRTKQIEPLVQNLQGVPKPLWCFHKASKGLGSQWPTLSLNLSNSCTRKNWIGQHCWLPTGRPPCCVNLLDLLPWREPTSTWIQLICMGMVFFLFTALKIPNCMHLQAQTNKYLQCQKDDICGTPKQQYPCPSSPERSLRKECCIQGDQHPQYLYTKSHFLELANKTT